MTATAAGHPGKRHRRRLTGGLALLLVILFNLCLEYRGAFEPFALATYDWFERPSPSDAPVRSPLVTVFLLGRAQEPDATVARGSDEDKILRMIQIISCAHPAVIGLDWRTGSWRPAGVDSLKSLPARPARVVWARELSETGAITGVAGGVSLPANWTVGIAAVKPDRDRAVRRYIRWFEDRREAFSWSVLKAYCAGPGASAPGCGLVARCDPKKDCEQQPLLNYRDGSDRFNEFSADALTALTGEAFAGCSSLPQSGENPFIKDQIVLIGDSGRSDLHETPYGTKNGVAIMAHAIQADLFGRGLKEQRGISVYLLHFLSVIIVILINSIARPFPALCLNVLGLPLLALIFSYLSFQSFNHWFDFVPILGGVIIHQLYEQEVARRSVRSTGRVLTGRIRPPSQNCVPVLQKTAWSSIPEARRCDLASCRLSLPGDGTLLSDPRTAADVSGGGP
jgi:CHASE2 domain-containing sensor protein